MQDGVLIMELKFDSGSMKFDPVSQTQPPTPATEGLTGAVWRWFATELNNDTEVSPPDPESYTIEFLADGQVAVQADCNRASGTYTANDGSMTITLGPSTAAFCGEASLDQDFLRALGQVAAYRVEATNLFLDLRADAGTMRFAHPVDGGGEGAPGMPRTGGPSSSSLQPFVMALFLAIVCLISGVLVYRSYHVRRREEEHQQVRIHVSRSPDGFSRGETVAEDDEEGSWR
jgi:heat shock protein HslJ